MTSDAIRAAAFAQQAPDDVQHMSWRLGFIAGAEWAQKNASQPAESEWCDCPNVAYQSGPCLHQEGKMCKRELPPNAQEPKAAYEGTLSLREGFEQDSLCLNGQIVAGVSYHVRDFMKEVVVRWNARRVWGPWYVNEQGERVKEPECVIRTAEQLKHLLIAVQEQSARTYAENVLVDLLDILIDHFEKGREG